MKGNIKDNEIYVYLLGVRKPHSKFYEQLHLSVCFSIQERIQFSTCVAQTFGGMETTLR